MSLVQIGLEVAFSVISPEPEVVAMIHLNLIYGHTVAFKRVQDCPNRLSQLRETDVSLVEIGLELTFSTISPEPEVAAMIYLHLICGHIMAFK